MKQKMMSDDNFIPGRFDYIESSNEKNMLVNGYQAINTLELWNYMKKDTDSYMWSSDRETRMIGEKMSELGAGHSGFSFGWTMRTLQYIAKNGEKKFKEEYLRKKQE
jgi:hypothetical protein